MNKSYILLIALALLLIGCKKVVEQQPIIVIPSPEIVKGSIEKETIKKEPQKKVSTLDSIRILMQKAYHKEYAEQAYKVQVAVKTVNSSLPCTPCDMGFLVYLSKKDDYNLEDIKTLLCLDNNDVCDDNVEFVPFYNEMIFKVFHRERKDLSAKQIEVLLQDEELMEELLHPIIESNSVKLIDSLQAVK